MADSPRRNRSFSLRSTRGAPATPGGHSPHPPCSLESLTENPSCPRKQQQPSLWRRLNFLSSSSGAARPRTAAASLDASAPVTGGGGGPVLTRRAKVYLEGTRQADKALRLVLTRTVTPGLSFSGRVCLESSVGARLVNQDALLVWEDFGGIPSTTLCAVFSGHGDQGHQISRRVRDSLPSILLSFMEHHRTNAPSGRAVSGVDHSRRDLLSDVELPGFGIWLSGGEDLASEKVMPGFRVCPSDGPAGLGGFDASPGKESARPRVQGRLREKKGGSSGRSLHEAPHGILGKSEVSALKGAEGKLEEGSPVLSPRTPGSTWSRASSLGAFSSFSSSRSSSANSASSKSCSPTCQQQSSFGGKTTVSPSVYGCTSTTSSNAFFQSGSSARCLKWSGTNSGLLAEVKWHQAFAEMNQEIRLHPLINPSYSGCSALVALLEGTRLYAANLGDSRCVAGVRMQDGFWHAQDLTQEHTPNVEEEKRRILSHGGRIAVIPGSDSILQVCLPKESSRGIPVTRAFGNEILKEYGVVSTPEVSCYELDESIHFIILGSRGLWDVVSSTEAVLTLSQCPSLSNGAHKLTSMASSRYSPRQKNDISVIVVDVQTLLI